MSCSTCLERVSFARRSSVDSEGALGEGRGASGAPMAEKTDSAGGAEGAAYAAEEEEEVDVAIDAQEDFEAAVPRGFIQSDAAGGL